MKVFLYLFLVITPFINVFSQDIIEKKDGTSIESKIKEIGIDIIKYNKYNNLSGPIYLIKKDEVSKIIFENGTIELIQSSIKYNSITIENLKIFLTENINKYGSLYGTKRENSYVASFEGDYLKLRVKSIKTSNVNKGLLYNFSTIYKFERVDKRINDVAVLNIWTLASQVKDNPKWKKHKLVMQLEGHEVADLILQSLKDFNIYLAN